MCCISPLAHSLHCTSNAFSYMLYPPRLVSRPISAVLPFSSPPRENGRTAEMGLGTRLLSASTTTLSLSSTPCHPSTLSLSSSSNSPFLFYTYVLCLQSHALHSDPQHHALHCLQTHTVVSRFLVSSACYTLQSPMRSRYWNGGV